MCEIVNPDNNKPEIKRGRRSTRLLSLPSLLSPSPSILKEAPKPRQQQRNRKVRQQQTRNRERKEKHKVVVVLVAVAVANAIGIEGSTKTLNETQTNLKMPKNSNVNLWRFPDHENWVPVRVNSGSQKEMFIDLKSVLQKFGLEEKFKQSPFNIYLDLKEPLTLYGQLIHNILKREINHPKGQRKYEM
ncbi:hypothetical protein LWI29_020035 [Acer saccharum]|uniref:Uncharacterized protein n=1 Tax=Acer saccharum TaxID=4024 RepID=A0AA39VW83_ACESA|nr:hypothetical protein LWI29_020035 [Acer saccharum]